MTPWLRIGSIFLIAGVSNAISSGCGSTGQANPRPQADQPIPQARVAPEGQASDATARALTPEPHLGVVDTGIWPDLDDRIQVTLPPKLAPARVSGRIDARRKLLVLAIDGFPRKTYPLTGTQTLAVGEHRLALRPGDHRELAPLLRAERLTTATPAHDRDNDGIPDSLDVLIGAKKTVLNAAAYTEGYISIPYPMGDVPRDVGVCTDVVIRAVRNAGIDLQRELRVDLARARAAYPMIKGRGNPQIDQRRVQSLLPYFRRHWASHTVKLDDPDDPLRPGDIIFMDTFPSRSGPDHIGIISDTIGDSGLPLVINNWTNGTVTAEMDLLTFVPVLHRYRLPE